MRTEGWDDVGGRGLGIVERMTRRWGIREGTTHVWFELDPGGSGAPGDPEARVTHWRHVARAT